MKTITALVAIALLAGAAVATYAQDSAPAKDETKQAEKKAEKKTEKKEEKKAEKKAEKKPEKKKGLGLPKIPKWKKRP